MTRSLVLGFVKHCEVYVIDGVREGNRIEITSNDVDYVLKEGEESGSGLIEVEVDAKSKPSTEERHLMIVLMIFEVKDNNLQSNFFEGFNGPMNEEVPIASVAQGDEGYERLMSKLETSLMDMKLSYEGDSDDMIKKKRFSKYNKVEMRREEYEFHVVLEFKSLNQFKDAIKDHALLNGRDICGVVCKEKKCNWLCFSSKFGGSDCFRIKTLKKKHSCGRNYNDSLASSSWI
ncbi:hypothetical protein Ahy_B09g098333 [Arachis hypogaea]|uniref:Transposase MuDR plant domain-containing protein n=1 Tax=Arachis hypogaea TaxID=3818 RepID=A0A444XRL6_ARAHY|nr:hypothetical protein Ahy_B09g098333 [Arachis hypogaea]